jgi:hypothetical protein
MWSVQAGDSGWSNINQLADNFESLQVNRRIAESGPVDYGYQQPIRRTQPELMAPMTAGHIGEPSWVAGLVGHDVVPRPRSAHTPHAQWQLPDSMQRPQQGMLPPQPRWDQGYLPQQPMGYGMPGMNPNINPNMGQYPGYGQPMQHMGQNRGHMGPPVYSNTPPPSSHTLGPEDQAVIALARSKGLNPATFNCRPQTVGFSIIDILLLTPQARFFVIKSYTVSRL